MNKKYIFPFVLFSFCLLLNVSYALPDFYVYENFLAGISPYSVSADTGIDENYVHYDVSQSNIGIVASYDNVSMSGDSRNTAVPLINLDNYTGGRLLIPSGQCVAVYSKGCTLDNFYVKGTTSSRVCIPLGTICPPSYNGGYYSTSFLNSTDSKAVTINTYDETFSDTTFLIDYERGSSEKLQLLPDTSTSSYHPLPNSRVWLVYANGADLYVYSSNGDYSTLPDVEIETIAFDNLEWFAIGFSYDEENVECVFLPYINGDIDLYVSTFLDKTSDTYINYAGYFRFNLTLNSVNSSKRTLNVSLQNFRSNRVVMGQYSVNLYSTTSNLVPAFIHSYNASRYNSQYAIYVYDGYFSVQNYDELIQKLKDAGFGQSGSSVDLSRIEELLEEINSGGENGQAVKELIETIEGLENQVFNNLDTTEIFSTWDTYKSLLDFSSLNWLIVANNRMFEIFCGVIVLSVIFIVFDRCLR